MVRRAKKSDGRRRLYRSLSLAARVVQPSVSCPSQVARVSSSSAISRRPPTKRVRNGPHGFAGAVPSSFRPSPQWDPHVSIIRCKYLRVKQVSLDDRNWRRKRSFFKTITKPFAILNHNLITVAAWVSTVFPETVVADHVRIGNTTGKTFRPEEHCAKTKFRTFNLNLISTLSSPGSVGQAGLTRREGNG